MTNPTAKIERRRADMPLVGRSMELREFKRAAGDDDKAPLATAEIVFSTGAAVKRYDWFRERYYLEVLVVEPDACNLARLERGAPLLNTHWAWSLEDQIGVCSNPRIDAGAGVIDAKFSRRESVAGYVQDVADGIIRNVSVGYSREAIEMVPPVQDGGLWTYRVVRWTPMEVSLVPIPADMDAQVRSAGGKFTDPKGRELRTFECEFIEVRTNPTPTEKVEMDKTPEQLEADRAAEAKRIADEARAAEAKRATDITELCQRHGASQLAAGLIRDGKSVDEARASVLEEIARRDAAAGGQHNSRVQKVGDEVDTRLAGMAEVVMARVDPAAKLTDNGKQYRGMSLIELGRDYLQFRGIEVRGLSRLELATQILQYRSPGMLSTSDFGSLLANVASKRLRRAYDESKPSYQRWARRAPNAPDFKQMSVVNLSAAPDLLQVNEHGEFKYGSMTDGKEVYSMLTYGRIVSFTRQALVNDDLRGFDRLIGAFGNSAARLENRTVYAILTANAALADTGALFNATAVTTAGGHANLVSSGTVINVDNLGIGRKMMRLQKGLQSEELNLAPAYLIVPAALEQVAYQYTSANYVPATPGNINEFRAGGRTAVEPIVEPILDANSATAWYLAADNAQIDTVEYCFLDGAEGPVIESEIGFEVDGISWKCREDFAAKAIDFRGLFKNVGA